MSKFTAKGLFFLMTAAAVLFGFTIGTLLPSAALPALFSATLVSMATMIISACRNSKIGSAASLIVFATGNSLLAGAALEMGYLASVASALLVTLVCTTLSTMLVNSAINDL